MSVYTRNGDKGYSSTIEYSNIPKNHPVFEVLGCLDEVMTAIGAASFLISGEAKDILTAIQQNLIAIMGEIAGGKAFTESDAVESMETLIDYYSGMCHITMQFEPKGKSREGVALDTARVLARKAERRMMSLPHEKPVGEHILQYINRLSDLLYIMVRYYDEKGNQSNQTDAPGGLKEMKSITLELSIKLGGKILAKAKSLGVAAVVAVADAGGNQLLLLRDEEAYIASVDVAVNKAYTCVALQMPTKKVGEITKSGEPLEGLENTNAGRIIIFSGGIPLKANGSIVGGLGVSGGNAEQDEALADYGETEFIKLIGGNDNE